MSTTKLSVDIHKVESSAAVRSVSLPDELWIAIFINLRYRALRRIEMTCKHFKSLMKDRRLAAILFRLAPDRRIAAGEVVEVHPMLETIDCISMGEPGDAVLETWGGGGPFNAFDYPSVDDYATSPAANSIIGQQNVKRSAIVSILMGGMSTSAQQSETKPDATPIALRVPPELWAQVSKSLKYADLKSLAGVCKAFKAMFEHPRYNLRLFRKPPTGQLKAGKALAIHPILDVADCVLGEDVNKAEILRGEGDRLNAFDYPAADEFATAPACTKIKLEMNERKCGSISCETGITVRQVLKRALEYWNTPVTGQAANQIRREWHWDANHLVTRRYTLGGHCFFEGWEYARVQSDGVTVVLASRWFGS
ncbi:hypothetical protein JCM10908_007378 [Rhodotorula pacifica]|uniref:uncharacterized protein n=1 Tax=Rhodotorula pacifica TaxID=1495444 RepID=UPI003171D29E